MRLKSQIFIFLAILVLTLISSGLLMSFFISEKIYSETLQHSIDKNTNFIKMTAESILNNNDFTTENYEQKQITFFNFFKNIDTSEILRIKVWSLDGTVIYSDNNNIVGKNFPDNANFKNSLTGQIIAEIKEPEKPKNIEEKGYGQLMEIYVPIIMDDEVSGIIETYVSLDRVNENISHTNEIVSTIILITIIIVFTILLIIYFLIKKNIIGPITRLQDYTKQIAKGTLNIHVKPEGSDEIQNLAHDVNKMSKELIIQRNKLIKNEKLKSIGEVSSKIAHDLRNPLSVIQVSMENIKMLYGGDEIQIKQFKKIERSIDRITHQVEEVLDFVKWLPSEMNNEQMSEIIDESMDSLNIPDTIKLILPKNDVQLLCDKKQFAAALNNLIFNSVQAIHGTGTIEVTVEGNNDGIIIQVKDSGKGIPKENINKIFEPLFTTKQQGTGLRLASVKSTVESHGGIISVTSPPTIFTITLPKTTD
ncbi:MAG: HAMP domain-containing histidine kinase [Nitrosopumilus sp.]|nr:HAMP domain-containing histidine kinase [Nitrosopumilus sp.]